MRKALFLISVVTSCMLFGANDGNSCPNLSKKSISIDESRQIALDLQKFSLNGADVYFDLLKKFNNTQDIESFIVKDTLAEVGETLIYGDLLGIKYRIDDFVNISHKYTAESDEIKYLEKEYLKILNSVDAKNKNWCNQGASDEVKEFVIKELRKKFNNVKDID